VDVFHLDNGTESEFQDVIDYLVESRYPDHLTREEK
jgi:hypothetical protein